MIVTYLSVALLIALVLVVRKPFAREFGAKAAYALWALPLARLVMPPVPSWMSPLAWFSASPAGSSTVPAGVAPAFEGVPPPSLKTDVLTFVPEAPTAPTAAFVTEAAPAVAVQPAADSAAWALQWPDLGQILLAFMAVVMAGAVFLIARQFHAQWQFARLIRDDSEAPSPELEAMAEAVQRTVGLKRRVPVRASFLCGAPLVTGVFRPVILVPAWFELDYTREEQRIALTHEAMHVKRGDLLALQLAHTVAAIQWLNPLAWRALDAFRADQEAACDADVLALDTTSPRAYGATLLKAIRLSRPGSAPAFAAALPLNHSVKERFAMLQSEAPTPPRKRLAVLLSMTAGAAALLATATAQEPELRGGEEEASASATTTTRIIMTSRKDGHREMVILTDPMAEVDAHLAQLDELEWPEPPVPPTPPIPPEPPVIDLSFLSQLDSKEDLEGLEMLANIVTLAADGSSLSINGGKVEITSKNGSHFAFTLDEDAIEEMVEQIEAQAEVFEERMDVWAEEFEASFEMDMEAFEAEVERMEVRIEEITESPEFEAMIERGTRSIETLREECEDEDMSEVDVAIITNSDGDKAICIDGEADRSAVEAAVLADPNLTRGEKQRFLQTERQNVQVHVTGDQDFHFRYSHKDGRHHHEHHEHNPED